MGVMVEMPSDINNSCWKVGDNRGLSLGLHCVWQRFEIHYSSHDDNLYTRTTDIKHTTSRIPVEPHPLYNVLIRPRFA